MAKAEEKKKAEAPEAAPAKPADKPKKGTLSRFIAFNGKNYKPGDAVPEGFTAWIEKTKRDAANYIAQE